MEAGDCYFPSKLMNTDVAKKAPRTQPRTKMLTNALYCEESHKEWADYVQLPEFLSNIFLLPGRFTIIALC